MKLTDFFQQAKDSKIATSGTGLLIALLILVIFIVAATWLKTVFFGLICAYLFLPLEALYEKIFFLSWPARVITIFFRWITSPVRRLRNALMRRHGIERKSAEEVRKNRDNALAGKAAALTVLTVLFVTFGSIYLMASSVIPYIQEKGTTVAEYIREKSPAAQKVILDLDKRLETTSRSETEPEKIQHYRDRLQELLKQIDPDVAGSMLSGGTSLIGGIFSFLAAAGGFAFDLLMFCFFFFFFLQRMAVYRISLREKAGETADDVGRWIVRSISESGWFPDMKEVAWESAGKILARVFVMFNAWLRGYGLIIVVETLLYLGFFSFFGVPYALPLALVAGLTILLPFLGPVLSFILSAAVTVFFAPAAALPLVGVCITYVVINGLLEQLFLYPVLVGEAIGLTTLETIVAVLFGAVVAGITGMILAVPAAALCKFLIPLVYDVIRKHRETEKLPADPE